MQWYKRGREETELELLLLLKYMLCHSEIFGKNKRRGVNIHRKIRDEIRDRARENFGKI